MDMSTCVSRRTRSKTEAMDMATCVARRTRSRTESYLISILNRSKGIPVKEKSKGSLDSRKVKKRTYMRNANSQSPAKAKRLRSKASEEDEDDVDFVRTILPEGKREANGNVGSTSVIPESKSVDGNVYSVDDANFKSGEELSDLNPSVPDDDDAEDDNVGTTSVVSPRVYDSLLDDSKLRDEEKISESDDEVVSLDSDEDGEEVGTDSREDDVDSVDDEDVDSDSSDYIEESSDSSYVDSSDSDFVCSEDEENCARVITKVRKSHGENVYYHEKSGTFRKENNLNVFEVLAKSTWDRTDDICFRDEMPEVDSRKYATVNESSSEPVDEDGKPRKPRKPRSFNRVKEKNHVKCFDVGENLCDGQETVHYTTPLDLRFGCEEPEPIEKTEEEKELDSLWEEMALVLTLEGMQSSTSAKNGDVLCTRGKHDFILDEEIGLKCCHCSYVSVEIKDISPAMDKYCANIYDNKKCRDRKGGPSLDKLAFESSVHSSYAASLDNTEGTVWQYVSGIKDTLYPHQQEGFEFIWRNLAGTTKLDELKSLGVKENGGCIISHSPGTGKTRLTIVFLQSYLERFPDSHPVVIAPASLLLTWEAEFRKWNAGIPFYNMNSLEFSGYENPYAVSLLKGNRQHKSNKHSIRMVKLYSWRTQKSILGVSYPLYEKLAGNKLAGEMQEFKRMLLELPGLLVLDEGHTPRNQKSCIWKVLSEVRTEKRIILSGTPFQNNFKELSNVLCLTRPAYTEKISSRLQELSKRSQESKNGRFNEELGILELKNMIAPFVHVHKGNVLRESLPGLRDCVVVLNPPFHQKKILDRIDHSQTTFDFERKLSLVSVHPSLYLCCNPTKKEQLLIGPSTFETLKKLRHDPKEGVKTRFLIDFIRFSETVKEKVLVFSQYIDTLKLIMEHISAVFGWTEGKEILFMHGQLEQKDRQHLINKFNKPENTESKVLLASTKACSEGINLVGASRVVLLDVVWNPSVERQAISRAYRIGQKRVVFTYHLMVKGTAEWDKYCKQTQKHRLSELVFTSTNEKDKLIDNKVVSEDRILDEMVRHKKLKDMFEKILYYPKESDMFTNVL